MGNLLSSLLQTNEMNPATKGVLLVVGSYVVTVGTAVIIIVLAIITIIDTTNCGAMSRALPALWITIAAIFLTSVIVVIGVARKITPSFAGCLAVVGVYGVTMLVSYVFIAFGLMVIFNC